MIKINLLPPGIFEARVIKRLIALFAVLLILVIGLMSVWYVKINKDADAMKAKADQAEAYTREAQAWAARASEARAPIANMKAKCDFFDAVAKYNLVYVNLYREIAKFTYARVTYSDLKPSGGTVITITAHAPSIMDAGRYLLNMYRATHLFSSVTISAVPGWPPESSTVTAAGMPAPAAQQANPMAGTSYPTMPRTSYPTGPRFGMAAPQTQQTMDISGLSLSGPSAVGPSVTDTTGGTGATGYGGLGAIGTSLRRTAAGRTGFDFTVTCTLKNPIVPPTPPSGASSQANPMGGGMGGVPTMPAASPTPPPAPSGGAARGGRL